MSTTSSTKNTAHTMCRPEPNRSPPKRSPTASTVRVNGVLEAAAQRGSFWSGSGFQKSPNAPTHARYRPRPTGPRPRPRPVSARLGSRRATPRAPPRPRRGSRAARRPDGTDRRGSRRRSPTRSGCDREREEQRDRASSRSPRRSPGRAPRGGEERGEPGGTRAACGVARLAQRKPVEQRAEQQRRDVGDHEQRGGGVPEEHQAQPARQHRHQREEAQRRPIRTRRSRARRCRGRRRRPTRRGPGRAAPAGARPRARRSRTGRPPGRPHHEHARHDPRNERGAQVAPDEKGRATAPGTRPGP